MDDPDDWIGKWRSHHDSEEIVPAVNHLALRHLRDPQLGSVGIERLEFDDPLTKEHFVAEVVFVVERHPSGGNVFHIMSLRGQGDPLPPDPTA